MQALAANGVRPYYWTHDNRYEVDFVFQTRAATLYRSR